MYSKEELKALIENIIHHNEKHNYEYKMMQKSVCELGNEYASKKLAGIIKSLEAVDFELEEVLKSLE